MDSGVTETGPTSLQRDLANLDEARRDTSNLKRKAHVSNGRKSDRVYRFVQGKTRKEQRSRKAWSSAMGDDESHRAVRRQQIWPLVSLQRWELHCQPFTLYNVLEVKNQ